MQPNDDTASVELSLRPLTGTASVQDYIESLRDAISKKPIEHAFTCGGKLVHVSEDAGDTAGLQKRLDETSDSIFTGHVVIRHGVDGAGNRLELPTSSAQDPQLQKLISACDAAPFGVAGKEVLNENYRKAIKMNTEDFCTDFCPFNIGIIDIINQLLVPSVKTQRSVTAELYKLNIYSGPSGLFKAHVDTPRSELQLGSLVVCLPSKFEGGKLSVRNSGEEVTFDWAPASANSIQWAAFFSDREHEVHQITKGHRVTLTYNLFLKTRTDLMAGSDMSLQPMSHPLGQLFENAIMDPRFMPKGGRMGVYLTHLYPHTHKTLLKLLPSCLKGVDMAVYEIVRALGLDTSLVHTKSEKSHVMKLKAFETGEVGDEDAYEAGLYSYGEDSEEDYDDYCSDSDEEAMREQARTPRTHDITWLNKASYKECSGSYMTVRLPMKSVSLV